MSKAAVRKSSRRRTPRAKVTGLDGVVGAADRGQYLLVQVGAFAGFEAAAAVAVAEEGDRFGGAHEEVGGEAAGREDAGEVLGGGALVPQQP
jgi:hypothetical protein